MVFFEENSRRRRRRKRRRRKKKKFFVRFRRQIGIQRSPLGRTATHRSGGVVSPSHWLVNAACRKLVPENV